MMQHYVIMLSPSIINQTKLINKFTFIRESACTSISLKMASKNSSTASNSLITVDFEVHGKVQGVFFRKHTQSIGNLLGVRGWCRNTPHGTVIGNLEGLPEKVVKMKEWLKTKGSPKSRIDKVEFKNEKSIYSHTHSAFTIIK